MVYMLVLIIMRLKIMKNKNIDIQKGIAYLCVELVLQISNIIADLNKTKLKAYSWELERISNGIYVIKTLVENLEVEYERNQ